MPQGETFMTAPAKYEAAPPCAWRPREVEASVLSHTALSRSREGGLSQPHSLPGYLLLCLSDSPAHNLVSVSGVCCSPVIATNPLRAAPCLNLLLNPSTASSRGQERAHVLVNGMPVGGYSTGCPLVILECFFIFFLSNKIEVEKWMDKKVGRWVD